MFLLGCIGSEFCEATLGHVSATGVFEWLSVYIRITPETFASPKTYP